jgi:dTMP kinase
MIGKYLVLEGIDGAGTTTLQEGLVKALRASGLTVHVAAQPSDAGAGAMARQLLKNPLDEEHERAALALCFATDRLALRQRFERELAAGHWVVCDRSVLSSLVYQGSELDEAWVASINRYALAADQTFLLDVTADVAWSRIGHRGQVRERFEVPERLRVLRQRYLDAVRTFASPVRRIDASQSPDAVLQHALRALRDHGWLD